MELSIIIRFKGSSHSACKWGKGGCLQASSQCSQDGTHGCMEDKSTSPKD